jgi:UDP-glucose 4-epimerase
MHFAAYAYVGESTTEPAKYYDNNIGGSAKLLQACAAFDCRHVVFLSSCATYGIPERLPITEATPQNPVNPYGYTNLVVERMLRDAEAAYGIRHVALRYFNAAGARPGRRTRRTACARDPPHPVGPVCRDGARAIGEDLRH